MSAAVRRALAQMPTRSDELTPDAFAHEQGTAGKWSSIGTLQADLPFAVQDGNIKLAIPCYESFVTDGTQNNAETFDLAHPIVESPDTLDAVAYASDSYLGAPSAIDYTAGTVEYADPGTNRDLHVFYITSAPATFELEKQSKNQNAQEVLKTLSLGLVHRTDQNEQPEHIRLRDGLTRFLAEDMTLHLRVKAPYVAALSVVDSASGTRVDATNAVTQIGVTRGTDNVAGLNEAIVGTMGH